MYILIFLNFFILLMNVIRIIISVLLMKQDLLYSSISQIDSYGKFIIKL